jgi:hypothetical protein
LSPVYLASLENMLATFSNRATLFFEKLRPVPQREKTAMKAV